MKKLSFENAHRVNSWVILVTALMVLFAQFVPILSLVALNVVVCVLAGSVVLDRFLRRLALHEAFESLDMTEN